MRTLSFEILRRVSFVVVGAVALAGAAGCKVNVVEEGGDGCEYNGETYDVGESFPAGDGCNTCSCQEDGTVGCTLIGCVDACEWEGQVYLEGDTFAAGDGCNTCSCEAGGAVACTLLACVGDCYYDGQYYPAGSIFPASDGCNTCECLSEGDLICTDIPCAVEMCSYEGYFHAPGETWLSNNQCTSCTCEAGGEAECATGIVCNSCYYAGVLYESDQSFPALDGCNTCTCNGGAVGCTKLACPCDPAEEWYREYVATNPEACQVIDYACPPGVSPFFNDCGCGCEQPSWCPQSFDCMPPVNCDTQAIHELCPYSVIVL